MFLWIVFLALFLLCAGMSAAFMVYICIIWSVSLGQTPSPKPTASKGLSLSELERLPGVEDGGLVKGMECAVCLDDLEEGQPARVLPECRHAFHRPCADSWLSTNAVCPICRTALLPPLPSEPHSQVDAVV